MLTKCSGERMEEKWKGKVEGEVQINSNPKHRTTSHPDLMKEMGERSETDADITDHVVPVAQRETEPAGGGGGAGGMVVGAAGPIAKEPTGSDIPASMTIDGLGGTIAGAILVQGTTTQAISRRHWVRTRVLQNSLPVAIQSHSNAGEGEDRSR